MMSKAVVYYRTRPSEGEVSDRALAQQRQTVHLETIIDGLTIVAKFIEREGEVGVRGRPAFAAALKAAIDLEPDEPVPRLLIASDAAIGSGRPFKYPWVSNHGVFFHHCGPTLHPPGVERALPPDPPGPLCLYGVVRPERRDTLIYLCNAGPEALTGMLVAVATVSDQLYLGAPRGLEWNGDPEIREMRLDLPAGQCVLVNIHGHTVYDYTGRYELSLSDDAGEVRRAVALDLTVTLSTSGKPVWVKFGSWEKDACVSAGQPHG